jgi:hypothetical protein
MHFIPGTREWSALHRLRRLCQRTCPRFHLDSRLGGPQSRSGCFETFLSLPGIEPRFLDRPAHSLVKEHKHYDLSGVEESC